MSKIKTEVRQEDVNDVRRHVLNEMQSAAAREDITLSELPMADMEALAASFVERGLHEKP